MTGVAVNITDVPAQIAPVGLAAMVTLGVTLALTVIVRVFEVAGDPVAHAASEVSTHVIASLFRGTYEYVGMFVPALTPLTFHWYDGAAPPFVGVAVNVTDVPVHIAPAGTAAILTLAGRTGLTTIVIVPDVAGLPVTHGRLDVM